jgi:Ni/Co efflux regulator RcnB
MKLKNAVFVLPILGLALTGLPASAQDHPDQDRHANGSYRQHNEWKKGSRVQSDDWNRGDKLDYRQNHLRRPPSGYEWRKIDGNYVLANQDGLISTVRPAPRDHQRSPDEHPR